jgi:branched-chain amino acid transport system substrate-binding protein
MQRKSIAALTTAFAFLLTGCGGPAASSTNDGPIKIGMVQSLSGPAAPFGTAISNAAQIIADKTNADGGVNGRKIELIILDDATNPTTAAQKATELIQDKVAVIIGASTSSATLAIQPIAAQAKTPVFAIAGAEKVLDPKAAYFDWSWRVAPDDPGAIPAMYHRLKDQGHKRIAIFAQDDAYGEYGANMVERLSAEGGGLEIGGKASAPLNATDVTPQATKIRDMKPDAVLLQVSSVGLAAGFLRAAKDVGLDVPMLAGTGASQQALIDAAGESAKNITTANVLDPSNLTAGQKDLYAKLEAAGKKPQYGFADLSGAVGMQAAITAIKEAGSSDGEKIRQVLADGKVTVEGLTRAPVTFSNADHNGLPIPEGLVWTRVVGGKFVNADK